jgi:hypothetical protein
MAVGDQKIRDAKRGDVVVGNGRRTAQRALWNIKALVRPLGIGDMIGRVYCFDIV